MKNFSALFLLIFSCSSTGLAKSPPKQSLVLTSNYHGNANEPGKQPPSMTSSLADFFKIWPDYQHFTPRSGREQLGGVVALESREDMFMYLRANAETVFFSVSELRFQTAAEAKRAFDTYVRESDPVRGHAVPWEMLVAKGDRIFYMRTGREFPQREKLVQAFLKAIDEPRAPQFMCVDTYGCKLQSL